MEKEYRNRAILWPNKSEFQYNLVHMSQPDLTTQPEVAIIGAGPSGLALAAALKRLEISYRVFEKESFAGGTYARIHPELTLVSPRFFSALPYATNKLPKGSNLLKAGDYKHYMDEFISTQQLRIETSSEVSQILPDKNRFSVVMKNGKAESFRYVVLATGALSFPKMGLPGLSPQHSQVSFELAKDFKGAEHYRGKTVLVVGSGTSASEIASLLAPVTETVLVTRPGFKTMIPKVLGIDAHFLVRVFEFIPIQFLKKYCQVGSKDPVFDFGTEKFIKTGKIKHFLGLKSITENQAVFENGMALRIDTVIQCTGYRFDTAIVSEKICRNSDLTITVKKNQSLSHPGFFVLGYPCAGSVDSKFLRGISRDAVSVAQLIKKDLLKS